MDFPTRASTRRRDVVAGYVERGEVPGLVTPISRRGETHGEAIFGIASLTKPITAAATTILVEECKLRLDEPVDRRGPAIRSTPKPGLS